MDEKYHGLNRRKNMGNGKTFEVVKYAVIVIVAVAGFYFTTQQTNDKVKILEPKVTQLEIQNAIMQTDLKYIKEVVIEIKQMISKK